MEEGTVVPPNRIVESSGNATLTLLKTNKKNELKYLAIFGVLATKNHIFFLKTGGIRTGSFRGAALLPI